MLIRHLTALFAGLLALAPTSAFSQDYPVKPVRILTSPPGGGNDYVARIVAQALTGPLGQPVVIDNRGTLISIEVAAKAPPDGYSLLVASSSLVTSHLLQDVSLDPMKDFAYITHIGNAPNVLTVHPSLPVKSVKDLIALAKTRPGELNYGSSGAGSSAHLAGELLKSLARVNLTRITYRGNGASLIGLLSGEIQVLFPTAPAAAPHVKSGKMRALAVTGLEPSVLAPGLPTMVAAGLPGHWIESIYGLVAPAKTPAGIIKRLDFELGKALQAQGVKEKLLTIGIETVSSTPQKYATVVQDDIARMAKLIKQAGIRVEY